MNWSANLWWRKSWMLSESKMFFCNCCWSFQNVCQTWPAFVLENDFGNDSVCGRTMSKGLEDWQGRELFFFTKPWLFKWNNDLWTFDWDLSNKDKGADKNKNKKNISFFFKFAFKDCVSSLYSSLGLSIQFSESW